MRLWLRRIAIAVGGLAAVLAAIVALTYLRSEFILRERHDVPSVAIAIPSDPQSVSEGRRLATMRGCLDGCHGARGEGMVLFDIPAVGRVVAPNLAAAAARYSDSELVTIIRNGVRPDGRSLLVMPSESFVHLTDGDVGQIVASLRRLGPLDGPGPSVSLGPLGRLAIAAGKFRTAAAAIAEAAAPPAARTDAGTRGRYLALTVCSECHGTDLRGGANPEFVSPDLRVVAAYSPSDFTRLVRTGVAIGGRELGLMRVRARHNLYVMTDAEIAELYEYLHALVEA